jgi:hypothetical protein
MNSKQIATTIATLISLTGTFFAKDKLIVFITNFGENQTVTITPPTATTSPTASNIAPSTQQQPDRSEADSSPDFTVEFRNGAKKI